MIKVRFVLAYETKRCFVYRSEEGQRDGLVTKSIYVSKDRITRDPPALITVEVNW